MLDVSRKFVCVRLITYEDKDEARFLATLGGTRAGGVANTSFALLAPDGVTPLSVTGRSARAAFPGRRDRTLRGLVAAMQRIAAAHPGNGKSVDRAALPYLKDVRRALNVASCDDQPLVVVSIRDEHRRRSVEEVLGPLAWHADFRGRFAFARVSEAAELKPIADAPKGASVFVVQPDTYGLKGTALAKAHALDEKALRALLVAGLARYEALDKSLERLQAGVEAGVTWESESLELRPRELNGRDRRRSTR